MTAAARSFRSVLSGCCKPAGSQGMCFNDRSVTVIGSQSGGQLSDVCAVATRGLRPPRGSVD